MHEQKNRANHTNPYKSWDFHSITVFFISHLLNNTYDLHSTTLVPSIDGAYQSPYTFAWFWYSLHLLLFLFGLKGNDQGKEIQFTYGSLNMLFYKFLSQNAFALMQYSYTKKNYTFMTD